MTTRTDEELSMVACVAQRDAPWGEMAFPRVLRALYDLGRADQKADTCAESDERLRLAWQWCIVAREERWCATVALVEGERRRAQAVADVERLTRERDEALTSAQILRDAVRVFQKERDEARAELTSAATFAGNTSRSSACRPSRVLADESSEPSRAVHEAPGTVTVTTCATVDPEQVRANGIRDALYAAEYVMRRDDELHDDAHRLAAALADDWADRMRAEQKADRSPVDPSSMTDAEERARVVAWLRRERDALQSPVDYDARCDAADEIERGEHDR